MNQAQHRLALPEGTELHWYRIRGVLGKGGFGITYLAQDTNLDRPAAIKEFLPTEFATRDADHSVHPDSAQHEELYRWGLNRFIEEARLLSRFEHPNIVRVHTVFEENNTGYMVMAYEEGRSLKALLNERSTLDESTLLGLLLPVLEGLEQVHQKQFIHRDIKPDNIYVREDGSPVLLDFGSARQSVPGESRTLTTMVSPGYAPFEQYHPKGEDQGPWTDIYSLGATLFRAISGVNPVDAVTRSHALLGGKPDPLPVLRPAAHEGYSPALLAAVNHALCFQPNDRPQTIAQWRQELHSGDATVVVPRSKVQAEITPSPGSNKRHPLLWLGALALLSTVLLGYGWMTLNSVPVVSDTQPVTADTNAISPSPSPAPKAESTETMLAQRQAELQQREQQELERKRQEEQERLARQEEQERQAEAIRIKQELARQEEQARARALKQQQEKLQQEKQKEIERSIETSAAAIAQRQAQKQDVYPFAEWPQAKPLQSQVSVNVAASDKRWTSAGVMVERGRQYRIVANGQWQLGALCKATDATGQGMYTLACWDGGGQTVAGYPHGALIAKVGKNALAFYVGPEFEFTAPLDGPLYFMVNEAAPFFGDNSGALSVVVSTEN